MADIIKIGKPAGDRVCAFIIDRETINEVDATYAHGISKAIEYDSEARVYRFDSVEMGHFGESCREGYVVRYEEVSDPVKCPAGYNLWTPGSVEEASKRFSILSNTEFYQKTVPVEAILFDSVASAKAFLEERNTSEFLEKNVEFKDNEIVIHTPWGDASGKVGSCFIVCYKKDDCNILTFGTPSVDKYFVMDGDGNFIKKLSSMC